MVATPGFVESHRVFFFVDRFIDDRILQILDHQDRESIVPVLRVALMVPGTLAWLP